MCVSGKIGEMAVVECDGRIVRSDAVFSLRKTGKTRLARILELPGSSTRIRSAIRGDAKCGLIGVVEDGRLHRTTVLYSTVVLFAKCSVARLRHEIAIPLL